MDGDIPTGGDPDAVKVTMTSQDRQLLQTVRADMRKWFGEMWTDKMSRTPDGWIIEAEVKG